MSVNDAHVMGAWGKALGVEAPLEMWADGNAELSCQLGIGKDSSGGGMGLRCFRFAIVVDRDATVEFAALDAKGLEQTSAERVLEFLATQPSEAKKARM